MAYEYYKRPVWEVSPRRYDCNGNGNTNNNGTGITLPPIPFPTVPPTVNPVPIPTVPPVLMPPVITPEPIPTVPVYPSCPVCPPCPEYPPVSGITPTVPPYTQPVGWVSTDGGNLNLRATPSTSSAIIGRIPNGARVVILREYSDWYYVVYNNELGYVSKQYVVK